MGERGNSPHFTWDNGTMDKTTHARAVVFLIDKDSKAVSASDVQDVAIAIDRSAIEAQQERSMFATADTVCRVRVVDQETGKHAWFSISPTMRNGRPGVEVEAIGPGKTKKQRVLSTFREPHYHSSPIPE